jgi:hypothetical protein
LICDRAIALKTMPNGAQQINDKTNPAIALPLVELGLEE